MLKKFLRASYYAAPLAFLPMVASAQGTGLAGIFGVILDLINRWLIPIAIAVALLLFLWGLIKYITAGGDEENATAGRKMMINGIIVLFVMVAVWGLVNVLFNTFPGITRQGNVPIIPGVR